MWITTPYTVYNSHLAHKTTQKNTPHSPLHHQNNTKNNIKSPLYHKIRYNLNSSSTYNYLHIINTIYNL